MLFEGLAGKLQETFKKLKGKGKLTEKDVEAALREVRLALLEADVNFKVVKNFISQIKNRCIGQEVLGSLTPAQQVIKIVNEELTSLMGETTSKININAGGITVIMMVGLQGSGKTTTSAKLAKYLKKLNVNPMMVAADVYRPAAVDQIEYLGEQLDMPVFSMGQGDPVKIVQEALKTAAADNRNVVIVDTAGRLHVNQELMDELQRIKTAVDPSEILLVVDSMTGQDAVNVAESFHQQLGLTGVVLTKLDGDTRGGAALSVNAVTGCPIKFVGMGEKLDALEPFHPERMASRILGMGDVLSLIEKAQFTMDEEKAKVLEGKIRTQQFTLEDFLDQLQQVKSMGPLDQIMDMMPGMGGMNKKLKNLSVDEKQLGQVEAIIKSMNREERNNPEIINSSRRRRIALGSGTKVQDVNKLLKQFDQMKKMMKQLTKMEKGKRKGKKSFPFLP
ncbi:signal recognition particle protein [Candidatus Contubernalis alkaliaceticus]|uniref:signal recognition particle protein n=1 Tax=Candidatus Contubernalis alkaliaceticus TaxID=338645 RepID=UPI001F4BE4D4|nr:signal recognition particle protein [Candidatus Contubernalis alkalaceticus]UNC92746.1 signal recognition particle protein [Candidatus Contubernalis alkalaceticus]